jgi:DNA gyrase subunit A
VVVTAQGQVLRMPLALFRAASNKLGRMFARLNENDKVVAATLHRGEKTIMLASQEGHVIHFPVADINVLAGAGKGVMGIKLVDDDVCLGGALIGGNHDRLMVETSGGRILEFGKNKYEVTSRGGKGFAAVKRASFVRVVAPEIVLVDWDKVEEERSESAGKQKKLFE